jgi:hypothetical protein
VIAKQNSLHTERKERSMKSISNTEIIRFANDNGIKWAFEGNDICLLPNTKKQRAIIIIFARVNDLIVLRDIVDNKFWVGNFICYNPKFNKLVFCKKQTLQKIR